MGLRSINGVPVSRFSPALTQRETTRQLDLYGPPRMVVGTLPTHEVIKEPPNLEGLYPYQCTGTTWLRSRRNALLADEAGTGKCAQTLRAIPKGMGTLVVCPASVRLVWLEEAKKWRPDIRGRVLKPGQFEVPGPGELIAISPESLPEIPPRAKRWLVPDARLSRVGLVLDECHAFKSHKALRTQKVKLLGQQCASVWALTGTPILGKPQELWGVLSSAGVAFEAFGSWGNFLTLFGGKKGKWGGVEFAGPDADDPEIKEALAKVMLRRTRAEVLPNLPRKRYQDVPCEPPEHLMGTLDTLEEEWQRAGTQELPPFEMLSAVRAELAQARIPAMLEHASLAEENKIPLLVFSDHVEPVHAFAEREGWGMITGETPLELRKNLVDLFQSGLLCGLALTIAAGGVGLTLTRAQEVLFCDLNWTPALNEQAEDRAVRIGQKASSVLIKRLVTDHPLDRRVLELLDTKSQMIKAVLG